MKHFVKKHTHHFGLWALSGLLLIWSMIWLNNLDKQTKIESTTTSSAKTVSQEILRRSAPQNDSGIASSPSQLTGAPRNDNAPQDKQQTKPISADALANNVISVITPTEKMDKILKQVQDDNQQQTISVTFKIITPAATKEFITRVPPQSTVYDAMKQLQSQIPIKFTAFSGLGAFVEAIDNLANNSKTNLFWIYYINGQAAKLGISSIKLNSNDIITWRYEEAKY